MELKVEMHFLFHCLVSKSGYTVSANASSLGGLTWCSLTTLMTQHSSVLREELEEAVLEDGMSVHGAHVRILGGGTVRRGQGRGVEG